MELPVRKSLPNEINTRANERKMFLIMDKQGTYTLTHINACHPQLLRRNVGMALPLFQSIAKRSGLFTLHAATQLTHC